MTFANKTFKTKTEALTFFKNYLSSNDSIPDEDYPMIEAFIQNHPRGLKTDEKVIITTNTMYGKTSKCFAVVDSNGTVDQCSYKTAINGYNKAGEVKWCMRDVIQPQIDEFRRNDTILDSCPMCHSKMKEIHVDHIIPFCRILSDFLTNESLTSLTFDDIAFVKEVGQKKRLKDEELGKRFADYHKEHAQLRYLCAHCNITRDLDRSIIFALTTKNNYSSDAGNAFNGSTLKSTICFSSLYVSKIDVMKSM